MLDAIHDDTWNVLNMQRITPDSKRWDYSDNPMVVLKRLKALPTWLKVTTTLEKTLTPIHGYSNIIAVMICEDIRHGLLYHQDEFPVMSIFMLNGGLNAGLKHTVILRMVFWVYT